MASILAVDHKKYLEVNTKFLHACENNDIDGEFGVKYWISQGADVNYWDDHYWERRDRDGDGDAFKVNEYVFGLKIAATRNYPETCN